eukprot:scaffold8795_cov116-Isochrysis_galbana.AAC.5
MRTGAGAGGQAGERSHCLGAALAIHRRGASPVTKAADTRTTSLGAQKRNGALRSLEGCSVAGAGRPLSYDKRGEQKSVSIARRSRRRRRPRCLARVPCVVLVRRVARAALLTSYVW